MKKKIDEKKDIIKTRKKLAEEREKRIKQVKQKEQEIAENPEDFTQITVLNKSDIFKEKKNLLIAENKMVLDNIENKFKKNELRKKREEEIQKRKFSYFNKVDQSETKETSKRKQFFDETSIKKTFSKKNNEKTRKNSEGKKKLEKRTSSIDSKQNNLRDSKENEILAAIIKKPSSIVELKEQLVNSKREVLNFENNQEELGIKQKKILKEFANIIKNKPVKIIIKTNFSNDDDDSDKFKKISKSRSLYIRAFLINQGISHNRIKIETNEENITKNWKNEVILNFIGV